LAIDIAVGAEGRGGVELARRGFHVLGIEADAQLLARTFEFAQQHNAHIELMTAKVEHSLVNDDSADLVTFFHGLHLVDTNAALKEAWRMLKPGGKLIAAWNDRDLSSSFIKELEDVMEKHVLNYNRFQKQRAVDLWSEKLTEGNLFRLIEYAVYPNPVKMNSPSSLLDVLDCMSFVRANLRGPGRKMFNNDVRAVLERRFDHHSFDLPLETKMYVLEKVSEEERRNGHHGKKKYHQQHDGTAAEGGQEHQRRHQAATTETIFTI
jgi:SAM-dependent methyltransferase